MALIHLENSPFSLIFYFLKCPLGICLEVFSVLITCEWSNFLWGRPRFFQETDDFGPTGAVLLVQQIHSRGRGGQVTRDMS